MKKITKILALTLALVTIALSCTSCGNIFDSSIFISKEEKHEMANTMRDKTLLWRYYIGLDDAKIHPASFAIRLDVNDPPYWIDDCFIDEKKMSLTITLKNYNITKEKYGTKCEEVIEFILPYEIKSANSNKANEIIISEDRKTVAVVYRHKDIDTPEDSEDYEIDDEIVIKYKK